jgi:hypothetical protein
MCDVPDKFKPNSLSELKPYLEKRIMELLNKTELSLEQLIKFTDSYLEINNPWIETIRDLANTVLDSVYYGVFLNKELSLDEIDIINYDDALNLYQRTTYQNLIQTLYESF